MLKEKREKKHPTSHSHTYCPFYRGELEKYPVIKLLKTRSAACCANLAEWAHMRPDDLLTQEFLGLVAGALSIMQCNG